MCLPQGPQHSYAGEAQTSSPSVSSQALYHLATVLLYPADGQAISSRIFSLNFLQSCKLALKRGSYHKKVSKLKTVLFIVGMLKCCEEGGGSVVECLTRDRGIAGSSFTRGTVLCP